jgi:hypothetical protein
MNGWASPKELRTVGRQVQRSRRPRFTDPDVQKSTGSELHPDRRCATVPDDTI